MKSKEVMSKAFIKVDRKDAVSAVLGKLKRTKHDTALIFESDKYKGLFSKHKLIKSRIDPTSVKAGKMIKHVPVLNGDENLKETARLIYTSNMPVLPVVIKGKVLGVVRAINVIDKLDVKTKRKKMRDVATAEPFVIHENDETATALSMMYNNLIDRLPVVDRQGNLISIVTLHDLITSFILMQQSKTEARGRGGLTQHGPRTIRAYRKRPDIRALPVKDFASPIIITASMDDNVRTIIDDMKKFGISSVVIVKGKKAVGIVTIRDLLSLFLKDYVNY